MAAVMSQGVFVTVSVILFMFLVCRGTAVHIQDGGQQGNFRKFVYTRELLLQFKLYTDVSAHRFDMFPSEMTPSSQCDQCGNSNETEERDRQSKKRKRGRRGGVRRRLKKNRNYTALPSMVLANVRSIRPESRNNNLDELCANVRFMQEFRHANVLCFSETWLDDRINDEGVSLEGFGTPLRMDRDKHVTGKSQGGGVCMYVREKWCCSSNVTVREKVCTPDVELLAVSLRPRYLPREFGQIFLTIVYIPPSADTARAAAKVTDTVHALQAGPPTRPVSSWETSISVP